MAATMLRDSAGHVQLTDEQFAKLVELLTPGYELSKLMLAQYQEAHPQAPTPPIEDKEPMDPNLPTGETEKTWPVGTGFDAPADGEAGKPAEETHETAGS